MNNIKRSSALTIVFLVIFSLLFPIAGFSAPDSAPPSLNNFSVSATKANPGDTISISADVTDEGAGVASVYAVYKAPEGTNQKGTYLTYNSETRKYEASISFDEYDAPGTWNINYIYVRDNQGNWSYYYHSKTEWVHEYRIYADLSEYAITVSNENGDSVAPSVNDFSVSATEATVGDTIFISADITDDNTGVSYVSVMYKAPEGTNQKSTHLEYNSETQKYEGFISFSEYDAPGLWNINFIYVRDNQGNGFYHYHSERERAYEGGIYTDLSEYAITIRNENGDSTPPTLNDLSVSATEVTAGETIFISADVTDDNSGVANVDVSYVAPEGTKRKTALLRYNSETGKYEGSISFNEYDVIGTWNVSPITVRDKQRNQSYFYHSKTEGTYRERIYTDLSKYAINVKLSDKSAPSTVIDLNSSKPVRNEWYTSDVLISFETEDEGSGVETTYYKLNDGEWKIYTAPFQVETEGKTLIQYYSIDKAGNQEEIKSEEINIDTTAPVTSTSEIIDDWVNEDVSLELTAGDEGSGVKSTEYRINGGEWEVYNGSLSITEDGENIVEFRSADVSGNIEETKAVMVKIDKTSPVLEVSFDNANINQQNHKLIPINASVNATDALSGFEGFELVSIVSNQADNEKGDGNTEQDIQGHETGTADTEFQVRAEIAKNQTRIYTVTYKATDLAGNSTTISEDIIINANKSKENK